ncbi:hypothetical protein G9A89_012989 [Geosiphon pyriformis]|nr:hypothetical protein G9A89_012989 [Geosiphon pyriformis]
MPPVLQKQKNRQSRRSDPVKVNNIHLQTNNQQLINNNVGSKVTNSETDFESTNDSTASSRRSINVGSGGGVGVGCSSTSNSSISSNSTSESSNSSNIGSPTARTPSNMGTVQTHTPLVDLSSTNEYISMLPGTSWSVLSNDCQRQGPKFEPHMFCGTEEEEIEQEEISEQQQIEVGKDFSKSSFNSFQTPTLEVQSIEIDPRLIQYDVERLDISQIDPELLNTTTQQPYSHLLSPDTTLTPPPPPPPINSQLYNCSYSHFEQTPTTPSPLPLPLPLHTADKTVILVEEQSLPSKKRGGGRPKKSTVKQHQKKIIEAKLSSPRAKKRMLDSSEEEIIDFPRRNQSSTTDMKPPKRIYKKHKILSSHYPNGNPSKLIVKRSNISAKPFKRLEKPKNVEKLLEKSLPKFIDLPFFPQPSYSVLSPEQDLRFYFESIQRPARPITKEEMLRVGTFLFDQLLSHASARPFVNPEAEDALVYRSLIKDLMDLTTAEQKLWARKYNTPNDLYADICQIMYNAFAFHRENDVIYEEAKQMAITFKQLVPKISAYLFGDPNPPEPITPEQVRLPHEDFRLSRVNAHIGSTIYIMPIVTYEENKKANQRLSQAAAERFDPLSRPLLEIFSEKRIPPMRFEPSQLSRNFVRMYISGGRTAIERCRDNPDALLVILSSIVWNKSKETVTCKALIAKPFGRRHDLDTLDFPELADARSWIRCAIINRVILNLPMSSKFYHGCLRTPYLVSKYDQKMVTAERHLAFMSILGLSHQNDAASETKNIWQNLCAEAELHDVPFESFESIGDCINVEAEGFFKRVFHVQTDESFVVQNFKEIGEQTLGTRITETVCCLKTKGLENTGQIISIYKGAEEELVGLSMKRYEQTLKEYAFNARRLLTAEQKYKLILDMVNGIRSIHGAGFAHRDLSEVNMMVSEKLEEKLPDGSALPELVIIDFGKAVFVHMQDVRRWSVGEVADETIDILPRIRTIPDHGYKLYRSIATLPRTKNDSEFLPHPIDPFAEDIYSLGILIWRIFSGQAPWSGILDTDLKGLRAIVSDSTKIEFHIERSVPGTWSRHLLFRCITVDPQARSTGEELHEFLTQPDVKRELLTEWSALGGRAKNHRKAL